jgi:uncharacterized protein YbjT (DUF2867 family)
VSFFFYHLLYVDSLPHSTGATGFIGGSVLTAIVDKFPSLQITALLRGDSIDFVQRYPNVNIAVGDFDSSLTIEEEARKADIVIRMLLISFGSSSLFP